MTSSLHLCVFIFPCRSFLCGGSTGLFIYAYCLYYYYARSDMSGFMQTSFFFGYMACICYGFFLMLGTVGFRAALLFVRHIYRSIKCEQAFCPLNSTRAIVFISQGILQKNYSNFAVLLCTIREAGLGGFLASRATCQMAKGASGDNVCVLSSL